jgi:hypothetical protein
MDYFDCYDELPEEVQSILNKFRHIDYTDYTDCDNLINDLNKVGWTCEYDLDAVPYNLVKL